MSEISNQNIESLQHGRLDKQNFNEELGTQLWLEAADGLEGNYESQKQDQLGSGRQSEIDDLLGKAGDILPAELLTDNSATEELQDGVEEMDWTALAAMYMPPGDRLNWFDRTTKFVFPASSASGTGNLDEEFSFKPARLSLS